MDDEKKRKLLAKILKGPPYEIVDSEELSYFFGDFDPDLTFSEISSKYFLGSKSQFVIKLNSDD